MVHVIGSGSPRTSGEIEISRISGETVISKISGETVIAKISGETVISKVSGETLIAKISGETVVAKVSGETVLAKISGETVISKISGETVISKVSGETVIAKISGETVRAVVSGDTIKVAVPTSVITGQTLISGTNLSGATPVAIGSAVCVKVVIKALATNSGYVYLGDSTVSSDKGFILAPGDSVTIEIDNVNKIYATSDVDGDKVCWIAFTG